MKKIVYLSAVVAMAMLITGCGSKPAPSATENKEPAPPSFMVAPGNFDIKISDFKFDPEKSRVEVGTTVVWTNDDTAPHTIKSDDLTGLNSTELKTGEKFEFLFNKKGTYKYSCGIHPDMKGEIEVYEQK
jgi:plastocyanin